jgi:amino acid adenylation domain-containing protein
MTRLADTPHCAPPQTPAWRGLLHDLVRDQSQRTPDAQAVTDGPETLTYRQLQDRATAVARWLAARGCGRGSLVGIALPRSAHAIAAMLGILGAGAAYVPLEPGYPDERLRALVKDARPDLIITTDADASAQRFGQEAEIVPASSLPISASDTPGAVRREVPNPEDPAYVIHTSGTTGEPKGVVVPHRAIRSRTVWELATFPTGPGDSVLHRTSLGFDISLQEIFPPLASGARVVVAGPGVERDPARLMRLIAEEQVTTIALVPSLLRALLDEDEGMRSCERLREVFCGGERLDRRLHDRFLRHSAASLHNMYGPTEYAIDATYWTCRHLSQDEEVPIGFPLDRTQLYVVDDRLRPVPEGEPGILAVAGAQLALCYLHRPDQTAAAFPDNLGKPGERMYLTGDIVRRRADGALEFVGRRDDQVKIRGHRVELGEVEAVLQSLPNVRQAAARILDSGDDGETLLGGYLIPGPDHNGTAAWRRMLRERAPAHLVPDHLVLLDALPLGPTGKLDRAALPDPRLGVAAEPAPLPAVSVTAAAVLETFREVLGRPLVRPDEDFFELGGNSLQAARLINRLRKRLNTDIPLATLFETSTPAGIAAALEDGDDA